jgi:hypothetical protein
MLRRKRDGEALLSIQRCNEIGLTAQGADDEIERFSEGLRALEDHQLTGELSKLYHYLKSVDHETFDEKKDFELTMTKRKIGSLEEEIGRRKKDGAWSW